MAHLKKKSYMEDFASQNPNLLTKKNFLSQNQKKMSLTSTPGIERVKNRLHLVTLSITQIQSNIESLQQQLKRANTEEQELRQRLARLEQDHDKANKKETASTAAAATTSTSGNTMSPDRLLSVLE